MRGPPEKEALPKNGPRIKPVTRCTALPVGCRDGRRPLISSRHQVVEVFAVWRAQRFASEVLNDQRRQAHELLELAFVEACGASRMHLPDQIGLRDERHVVPLTRGAMAQRLG